MLSLRVAGRMVSYEVCSGQGVTECHLPRPVELLLLSVPVTGKPPAGSSIPTQSMDREELPVPGHSSLLGKNVWGLPTLGSSSIYHGLVRNDS